jgi:hypothetical protein
MDEFDGNGGRNGDDYPREPSPSTGYKETADLMDAVDGMAHTPTCETCDREGEPIVIQDGEDVREVSVRCSVHAKDFLEVSA